MAVLPPPIAAAMRAETVVKVSDYDLVTGSEIAYRLTYSQKFTFSIPSS